MAIIALYFLAVLGIGFYLKNHSETGEDFFLAGREMTAWIVGLSFLSANLGSLELMGWAGAAYEYGILAAHWYWIGAIPAMLFLGIVIDGAGPQSRPRPGSQLQHLGFFGHRRHLCGPRRAALSVFQRGAAVRPHLAGSAADPDPGPRRNPRMGQPGAADRGTHRGRISRASWTMCRPCSASPLHRCSGP